MGSCYSSRSSTTNDVLMGSGVDYPLLLEGDRRRRRRRRIPEQQQQDADEARLAEIMALQQSLAAMEDFFQSLLGQASFYAEALDPQNTGGGPGPPPVARHILEDLPDLSMNNDVDEDAVVSTGTVVLCGICGDECSTSDSTRLPCGHAFHRKTCIEPWLSRHCTCPICRYELPTDDETYEPGRVERMSRRKITEEAETIEKISEGEGNQINSDEN